MAMKTANSVSELEGFMHQMFGGDTATELLKQTQKIVFNGAGLVISRIKKDHPWKDRSGKLTRSLRKKRQGNLAVKLYTKVKYAEWLYNGSRKHQVPLFGDRSRMIWVSGVWGGGKGYPRDTPKNAPEKEWFLKGWDKQRDKTIRKIVKNLEKQVGL